MEMPPVSLQNPAKDIFCFSSYFPIIGFGLLPVNSFLIKTEQSILIDTGMLLVKEDYIKLVKSVISPHEIKWIYITHLDQDHIGNYREMLSICPNATVITTFVGMGKMVLMQLPVDRIRLLNPLQHLKVENHDLEVMRPPTFDAPETTCIFDNSTKVLFSTDSFGAILQSPVENADCIKPEQLKDALITWITIDTPWIHKTDSTRLMDSMKSIQNKSPEYILSSHLPPAKGTMLNMFIEQVLTARTMKPFEGPDQATFETMVP